MYTGHIAQCKLHCKNCTTTVAHICSINKMGRLHRMLILKACPYQQILSSKGTETTNGTTSQHHPYQQICWSTRWVNRPDCSFWPPFDISCHPETTKWVARPIWVECRSVTNNQISIISSAADKSWKRLVINSLLTSPTSTEHTLCQRSTVIDFFSNRCYFSRQILHGKEDSNISLIPQDCG